MKRDMLMRAGAILICVGQVLAQTPETSCTAPSVTHSATSKELCEDAHLKWMSTQLADWADLARYRETNAALPPVPDREQRMVFYGDSITDAWGRERGNFLPGKFYVNRGISGQTTPQLLVRFQSPASVFLP